MNYSFDSVLGNHMENFILEKRALGFKYETEEYILHKFNDYWKDVNGETSDVTPETLEGWLTKREHECATSQTNRIQTVRVFLKYLSSLGFAVYYPTLKYSKKRPVAYVLSEEEIVALFKVIDNYYPIDQCSAVQRLAKEYKVLFRILLATGMRRGEVSLLKRSDISFANRTITILSAKNQKDRIVYCADDVLNLLENYIKYLGTTDAATSPWLFPSVKPAANLSADSISIKFHKFWLMTPYYGKKEKTPTVHSLRHTFVVQRMNAWMRDGQDMDVMMPYLCRYLGHSSVNETYYYYHQVAEAFSIIHNHDSLAKIVIPEARIR